MKNIIQKLISEALYQEDILSNNGELKFDYSKKKGNIDTSLGKSNFKPRITTLPTSKVKVISAYSKKSGGEITKILKTIKQAADKPYEINDNDYEKFLKRTAIFFYRFLKNKNVDTIFIMESSSNLAKDIAIKIKELLPDTTIKFYDNSITKNIETLKLDLDNVKLSSEEKLSIERYYEKVKKDGNFSIKKIHPKHRKYFIDWIQINKESIKHITNKDVLLFDDYITSGATLDEVSKQLLQLSPKTINIITLIK